MHRLKEGHLSDAGGGVSVWLAGIVLKMKQIICVRNLDLEGRCCREARGSRDTGCLTRFQNKSGDGGDERLMKA